jgi:sigma-B regulation protein RsbU (phosphoserine phosphatase)
MAWSQFRAAATITASPTQILTAINSSLAATNGETPAINLFVGVLDIATGQLVYNQAGNFSPLLLQNEEVAQLPVAPTFPVGASADTAYDTLQAELDPNAILLLYTNGVTEVHNASGKPFGEKRLRGSVLQALKLNAKPAGFLANITETLKNFADTEPQANDQTMLLIRRNG